MANRRQGWKAALLTAAWLVGVALACVAQRPFQYKYGLADGLPLVEAEFIRFSKKGEVWVSYSVGEYLSRFDGLNWAHYRMDSLGLPSKLKPLNEDMNGLWFSSPTNQATTMVLFTPDEKWKTYKVEGFLNPFFDTKAGCLKLLGDQAHTFAYDPDKDAFVRSEMPLVPNAGSISLENYYAISQYASNEMFLAKWHPGRNSGTIYFGENFKDSLNSLAAPHHLLDPRGHKTIVTMDGQFYWQEKDKRQILQPELPDGEIGRIMVWVGLYKWENGPMQFEHHGFLVKHPSLDILYLFELHDDGSLELLLSHLDADLQRFFAQDPQGNWWYTTSTGIVRTDRSQLVFDERNPDMISGLHAIGEAANGTIWFGGYNGQGGFASFNGKRLRRHFFSEKALPVLPSTHSGKHGHLYFFLEGGFGLCAIKEGSFYKLQVKTIPEFMTGFYFQPLSDGKIGLGLFGTGLGIAEEDIGGISQIKTIGKEKGLLLDNVLTIAEDRGGRLWSGRTSQGIAIYDPKRDTAVTWLRSSDVPKSIGALASCMDESGTLWLGTNDGIYSLPDAHLFDYLQIDLFSRLQKLPLPGEASQRIHVLKSTEDYLIAGTPSGLYFLDKKYRGNRPRIFSMLFEQDVSGQGAEQNAILLDRTGRYLWVGTQGGATRLDLNLLRFDTSATTIRLGHFTAGDAEITIDEGKIGRLPTKKRNITFSFSPSGNTFLKDDLYFDIAVVNGQGDTLFWRSQTKERSGELPYLPKGKYTLNIIAYKHNVLSGEAVFPFAVPGLLSENPWFWAGLALVVLGIPFTFFYLKKRHQAELERSKRERDGLKIQALSNFFNPHFINNALHWVQSRYRKDPDTATIVGRLSENVDLLFANTQSGKAYHPLVKELDIVQNYLKIQQVRFGEGLQVLLDLPQGDEELAGVAVPSMLLQIHTENAVEKGIRNRKGAGHFYLSVKMRDDGCYITIEDDGRGRLRTTEPQFGRQGEENAVAELGSGSTPGHKGSTAVMDDLIALFNRYNKQPLTVRYEDLVFGETDGERHGTRVHFLIPKNYNYEFS